jgi:hypothetical protein
VKQLNAERTTVGLPHPEQKVALEHKLIGLSVHVTESFQGNAFKSEQGPTNKLRPVHVVTWTHRSLHWVTLWNREVISHCREHTS